MLTGNFLACEDGPVLSQIDLYLLQTELDVHPILKNAHPDFHLVFNMATGRVFTPHITLVLSLSFIPFSLSPSTKLIPPPPLLCSCMIGQTGGWHPDSREREMQFTQKDEPATMPRVQQLIILSQVHALVHAGE